ncbi:MAG: hypothetical protein IH621_08795 [Krumholzibacteria bacterium]|nr:hypothetical protein [Candidatus Krumholzibacteria bacterium]
MRNRFVKPSRFAGLAIGGAVLAMGWAIPAAWAQVPEQALRESQACLDCHGDAADGLRGGPHMVRLADLDTHVACTDCHAGTAAHWEDDPAANPMANPAGLTAAGVWQVCSSCHSGTHAVNQATLSPHADAGVSCLSCHMVHGRSAEHLLKDRQPELCYTCHAAVRGEFSKPFRHPAGDREFLQCSSCHLATDDRPAELAMQGTNAACLTCHNQFQGPFPYEHQAAVDYGTDEGGCIACHDPHGSYVPRLLKQPYEAPHYQTCTQCHVVPLHNYNSFHGSQWAGVSCTECHVDIHGSYTNKNFLTTALEGQGCFAAGCHSR